MTIPLTLGNKHFPVNIIQGPLAGISSAPFRLIASRYGKPAFTCTEMISCKTLVYQSKNIISRFLQKLPGEGPLCVQLSGTCPDELGEAVRIATDYGADLIDLNCGCPVKKIRRRGAGSAHLGEPRGLYRLITAMKKNTILPVSIKIRVDGLSPDGFNHAVLQAVRDAGATFVNVHGRHWRDDYNTPCHYEQIRYFVEELAIPVIGNGDVCNAETYSNMLATGCAGVMIARASVGQPWLLQNPAVAVQPPAPTVGAMFMEHVLLLADFLKSDNMALKQARTFCRYYARHLPERTAFCATIDSCIDVPALDNAVRHFFGALS